MVKNSNLAVDRINAAIAALGESEANSKVCADLQKVAAQVSEIKDFTYALTLTVLWLTKKDLTVDRLPSLLTQLRLDHGTLQHAVDMAVGEVAEVA